jgi:hypothetical protein
MLHHLEELAERMDVEVRYEAAAGRVGVCVLRGKRVAVIDANLRVPDRVAALASVLAGEELTSLYMPPEVRRRLVKACPLRVQPGDADVAEKTLRAATDDQQPSGDDTPDRADVHEDNADPEAGAD